MKNKLIPILIILIILSSMLTWKITCYNRNNEITNLSNEITNLNGEIEEKKHIKCIYDFFL